MSEGAWMKTASVSSIVQAVRQYGPLALCHNGLSVMENAGIAAQVIVELDKANLDFLCFFLARFDDSARGVGFTVLDHNPGMDTVRIVKVITRQLPYEAEPTTETVDGPLVPRAKAEAFCATLNELFGKN